MAARSLKALPISKAASGAAMRPSQATVAIHPELSVLGYAQVQLLDGPFREQFDHNHGLFVGLDDDALLKPFRQAHGTSRTGS